jgi:phosphoserine phosphatase RsbU/P
MIPEDPLLIFRGHLPELFLGPIFLFVGVCACIVAAIRCRGFGALPWFGLFIGMIGVRILAFAATTLGLAPYAGWPRHVSVFIDHFLVVPGVMFWVDLSVGRLRRFILLLSALGGVAALASQVWYSVTGRPYRFIGLNSLIALLMLLTVGVVVAIPLLSRKYLVIQSRVLQVVQPVMALFFVFTVASRALGHEPPSYLVPVVFVVWILALGYVTVQRTFQNERRLLTIESELETARRIQLSILPENVPALPGLRVAAAYRPMSAVAGDFYHFIELDEHRLGVVVADVSGHGVPAALIAAMMKTAVQSIVPCAHSPREVLQGLNRMLSGQGHDQFITAAYLFIDAENHEARYSAAGHPPLLLSRAGTLQRIESNGLVFGVTSDPDYPVRDLEFYRGDRLLLYTDGVMEAENAKGEAFGDYKLEQVILGAQACQPSDLIERLLGEIRAWQPASVTQQDDITVVAIDVM